MWFVPARLFGSGRERSGNLARFTDRHVRGLSLGPAALPIGPSLLLRGFQSVVVVRELLEVNQGYLTVSGPGTHHRLSLRHLVRALCPPVHVALQLELVSAAREAGGAARHGRPHLILVHALFEHLEFETAFFTHVHFSDFHLIATSHCGPLLPFRGFQ
jgi:hypothetical protein